MLCKEFEVWRQVAVRRKHGQASEDQGSVDHSRPLPLFFLQLYILQNDSKNFHFLSLAAFFPLCRLSSETVLLFIFIRQRNDVKKFRKPHHVFGTLPPSKHLETKQMLKRYQKRLKVYLYYMSCRYMWNTYFLHLWNKCSLWPNNRMLNICESSSCNLVQDQLHLKWANIGAVSVGHVVESTRERRLLECKCRLFKNQFVSE